MSIHIPYNRLRVCDLASGWSLAIESHVVLLVACRVTCHTIPLHVFHFSFHRWQCKQLVTCYWFQCRGAGHLHGRLCRVRGFLEKSCPGRVNTASSSAWSLAINFNGNQGGCLSSCRSKFSYMYLIQFFFFFNFFLFCHNVSLSSF